MLINCDDLGYGDLGCYGSTVNSTPALDRMATEGVRFTDFLMASPVCSPSRAALLTGGYPPRAGFGTFEGEWVLFPGQPVGLDPAEITIARLLRDRGYRTAMVGKWHCGDQPPFLPTNHGFDSYYGLPYSNDMGVQAGVTGFPPMPLLRNDRVIQAQPDQTSLTERYVEESIRFLRENRDGPFFLYLAHMYVHLPLYVPDVFVRRSRNGRYGAAVAAIDWAADVLLRELDALGLAESTLVIFTSDNGSRVRGEGGSNAPLRGTKGTSYEGGHRVPFIARWRGTIPAGQTCDGTVSSVDLFPTIAALAGCGLPTDRVIDGIDVRGLLHGTPSTEHPDRCIPYYLRDDLQAIRRGPWKLHLSHEGRPVRELYNLADDPGESTNLYDARPDVLAELAPAVAACRADLGDAATGVRGAGVRPIGRVTDPAPLTSYDECHPYIVAMYDLEERG